MNKRKDSPCKPDCPERSGECHATCQRYAKFAAKRRQELQDIQEKREVDRYFIETMQRVSAKEIKDKKRRP